MRGLTLVVLTLVAGCGTIEPDRALGGAGTGAATGATIGLLGGPVGIVGGALIGGLAGAATGAVVPAEHFNLGPPLWASR